MNTEKAQTTAAGGQSVLTDGLGASVICSTTGFLKLTLPVEIYWKPQPDITTYELARLLPIIMQPMPLMPHDVPKEPELLRHLGVHDPN